MCEKQKIFNIYIDNITMNECIQKIDKLVQYKERYHYVVTPNVDHIVRLDKDEYFKEIYDNADIVTADGMPIIWISKLLGTPIKQKISGSDLFPQVCKLAARRNYTMFLLGAAESVARQAAKNLMSKYKGLKIIGTFSPDYGFEKDSKKIDEIVSTICNYRPDILVVGLGSPKQEKFIYEYRDVLKVPLSLAIGASIDFEAGNIKRAPKWMQNFGLEWFYRFLKEPRRMFKRYFIYDMKIIKILLKYMKIKFLGE